jgi:Na+-transporting NADH:ubiquinone oxidoreductase subunit B
MTILNPALTARLFLFFAYPNKMSGNEVWINTSTDRGPTVVDAYSGETALGNVAAGFADKVPRIMELFTGVIRGSVGEIATLACLIGAGIFFIRALVVGALWQQSL